jgi:DNA polymerase III delta subunit
MNYNQASKIVKNNYPPENYTLLRQSLDFIIEQAEKAEMYKKALQIIIKQTSDDDIWDFANRVLKGKYDNILPYRINLGE